MEPVYCGEVTCSAQLASGKPCSSKACFSAISPDTGRNYYCGRHSRKLPEREELPKAPDAKSKRLYVNSRIKMADDVKAVNASHKKRGVISCRKLTMLKEPQHLDGYYSVFPNAKAGRLDMAMPELSPTLLGPIDHGQPNLPMSKNLENFWQSSKLHEGQTFQAFRTTQARWFESDKPCRESSKKLLGWVWTNDDETTILHTIVEAREFYCTFYERLAKLTQSWQDLLDLVEAGGNVNIIGYTGVSLDDPTPEELERRYLSEKQPFGHELVLVTMLACKQHEYPWVIHRTTDF